MNETCNCKIIDKLKKVVVESVYDVNIPLENIDKCNNEDKKYILVNKETFEIRILCENYIKLYNKSKVKSKHKIKIDDSAFQDSIIHLLISGFYNTNDLLSDSKMELIKQVLVSCPFETLIEIVNLYSIKHTNLQNYTIKIIKNVIKIHKKHLKKLIEFQDIILEKNVDDEKLTTVHQLLNKHIKSCKIKEENSFEVDSEYFKTLTEIQNSFKAESNQYLKYIDDMVKGDEYYWITSAGFKDWYKPERFNNFKIL